MSFTYKNQASLYHPIIIISIFLIAFGLCGFVLFRILHSFMNLTTGSGISPIFTLPWLSSIILGTTVLFSALSFRKRPFINGNADGLTIYKGWKSYHFPWDTIQSITYQKKMERTLFRYMDCLDRAYYEYLLIDSDGQGSISLEITYIEGGTDNILQVLGSQFKNIKTEDKTQELDKTSFPNYDTKPPIS